VQQKKEHEPRGGHQYGDGRVEGDCGSFVDAVATTKRVREHRRRERQEHGSQQDPDIGPRQNTVDGVDLSTRRVMIGPDDRDEQGRGEELTYAGHCDSSPSSNVPSRWEGALRSSTRMVIAMANTPSLSTSVRFVLLSNGRVVSGVKTA
jgi:hypothetical protein